MVFLSHNHRQEVESSGSAHSRLLHGLYVVCIKENLNGAHTLPFMSAVTGVPIRHGLLWRNRDVLAFLWPH